MRNRSQPYYTSIPRAVAVSCIRLSCSNTSMVYQTPTMRRVAKIGLIPYPEKRHKSHLFCHPVSSRPSRPVPIETHLLVVQSLLLLVSAVGGIPAPKSESSCETLGPACQRQGSRMEAYLRSFSIRSTWVMIMRRQQYRLRPSSSMASLFNVAKCQQAKLPPYDAMCFGKFVPICLSGVSDEL